MKKPFPSFISIAAMLYASLLLSCSSGDEQKPSTGETAKFCIYKDTQKCYSTSQTTCPVGGELSDFCPYEGSNVASSPSVVPSSNSTVPLSSSSKPSSSSVADDGCVGIAIAAKDVIGGTPRPICNSSNSAVSSSSSKPIDGVECDGYCKWNDGCVRIATDPKGVRDPSKSLSPILSCDEAISNCKLYSPTGNVFSNSTCDIVVITPSSSSVVPSSSSPNNIGDYCNWKPTGTTSCSYDGCNCWPIEDAKREECRMYAEIVVTCPNGGPKSSSSSSSVMRSSSSIVPSSSSYSYPDKGNNIANYRTVRIGTQTWMAENLNYNVSGSKCYAEGVSGVSADSIAKNCATYGRLYRWVTAMALPDSCEVKSCASQISAKHRGICPSGWHIPIGWKPTVGDSEWLTLYYNSLDDHDHNAMYLKATSGWDRCDIDFCKCYDTYGFSALPGGSGDGFNGVGIVGRWWSSSEYDAIIATCMSIEYNAGRMDLYCSRPKYLNDMLSVRCVKD